MTTYGFCDECGAPVVQEHDCEAEREEERELDRFLDEQREDDDG